MCICLIKNPTQRSNRDGTGNIKGLSLKVCLKYNILITYIRFVHGYLFAHWIEAILLIEMFWLKILFL